MKMSYLTILSKDPAIKNYRRLHFSVKLNIYHSNSLAFAQYQILPSLAHLSQSLHQYPNKSKSILSRFLFETVKYNLLSRIVTILSMIISDNETTRLNRQQYQFILASDLRYYSSHKILGPQWFIGSG